MNMNFMQNPDFTIIDLCNGRVPCQRMSLWKLVAFMTISPCITNEPPTTRNSMHCRVHVESALFVEVDMTSMAMTWLAVTVAQVVYYVLGRDVTI